MPILISKISYLFDADSWSLLSNYASKTIAFAYPENSYLWFDKVNYLSDHKWHHIVIVFKPVSSSKMKKQLYIDGVNLGSILVDIPLYRLHINTLIGRSRGQNSPFYYSYLDDVKIWKRSLSANGVGEEYSKNNKSASSPPEQITNLNTHIIGNNLHVGFNLRTSSVVSYRLTDVHSGMLYKAGSRHFSHGRGRWHNLVEIPKGRPYLLTVYSENTEISRTIMIR